MGFVITDISENPEYGAWASVPPSTDFFLNFIEACENPDFRVAVEKIRDFHMQVESRSKIIFGLSLIQEFLKTEPINILTELDQKELEELLKKSNLSVEKIKKVTDVLTNRQWMAIESERQRIAKEIARCLQEDVATSEARYKKITDARNYNAHSSKSSDGVGAIMEIETILEMYLIRKFGFVRTTGQLLKNGI
jgi:hypothetical protein